MKIEEIEKDLEGITPGEWQVALYESGAFDVFVGNFIVSARNGYDNWDKFQESCNNAKLIAAAPQIIRSLIARVRETEKRNERLMELAEAIAGGDGDAQEMAQQTLMSLQDIDCEHNFGGWIAGEVVCTKCHEPAPLGKIDELRRKAEGE